MVAAGVYSQKLAREQRATPAACRALLRAVRFAVPLVALLAAAHTIGYAPWHISLDSVASDLEQMLMTTPRRALSEDSELRGVRLGP